MPKKQENSFFTSLELEKMSDLRQKLEAEADEKAKQELKALHYLKCGKCGNDMKTIPFKGIEIEQCDHCGEVLLDPGELEEIAGPEHGSILGSLFSIFGR